MKIKLFTMVILAFFAANVVLANSFDDSIKEVSILIEKDPNNADNYLKRGNLYTDLWESDKTNIENLARGVADLSKYISLKPNDVEAYRKRAKGRENLFQGANTFSIADYKKILTISPTDQDAKTRLEKMQADYQKRYNSKVCKENRKTHGFQGTPSDTPMHPLYEKLDDEMTPDSTEFLDAIGCGADMFRYFKLKHSLFFTDFYYMKLEHLVGVIEAGINIEGKTKDGNMPLMNTLEMIVTEPPKGYDLTTPKEKIDADNLAKIKIFVQYGANVNAKNNKGRSVLDFANRTKNNNVIQLLKNAGAK